MSFGIKTVGAMAGKVGLLGGLMPSQSVQDPPKPVVAVSPRQKWAQRLDLIGAGLRDLGYDGQSTHLDAARQLLARPRADGEAPPYGRSEVLDRVGAGLRKLGSESRGSPPLEDADDLTAFRLALERQAEDRRARFQKLGLDTGGHGRLA